MAAFFDTPVEFLKGVGPQRASLLNKELSIFTYGDLIQHYPFRYEDRTRFYRVRDISDEMQYVQVRGVIKRKEIIAAGRKKRLVAQLSDSTGDLELVWFQGISWIVDRIKPGVEYVVFGKPNRFGSRWSMVHPEFEEPALENEKRGSFYPVYPSTEKLRARHIDSKFMSRLIQGLLRVSRQKIRETLPEKLCAGMRLISKVEALNAIHFPPDNKTLLQAQRRLKFEELFYVQLRLIKLKLLREERFKGYAFSKTEMLTAFYNEILPFPLTDAQKRVIKEIYSDLRSGRQMNRLLQGDVGSGKTIVAFICMLIVIGSGAQCALMAPTEILAQQHFNSLNPFARTMNITIGLLTGSVKRRDRKAIHEQLISGEMSILIGTHALLEEHVRFNKLGLSIVDEQHRFGVAQRSKLWKRNSDAYPHVLIMTATPIPRTLAMTLYGDLDVSVIDELPIGRKPIRTTHRTDSHRLQVNGFIRRQIEEGRQVYMVYPLIDESEKLDLKHVMDGYESVCRSFPDIPVSIVHGRMNAEAKDFEMTRFANGETKIMVATTVIEVGVDVPNASVMVIENAERFGLLQLHQLRGRVGRGPDQSFCILMTSEKLTTESRRRIDTMVGTNDGFAISEVDLELRGPGDLMGTQQSGVPGLLIADLSTDGDLLREARAAALEVLKKDPILEQAEHAVINRQISSVRKSEVNWSRIS